MIVVAVAAGMMLGAWNAFWTCVIGLPSFIVTLAGLLAFRGIGSMTDARTISPLSDAHVALSEGFISPSLSLIGGTRGLGLVFVSIFKNAGIRRNRGDRAAFPRAMVHAALALVGFGGYLYTVEGYHGTPTAILWTIATALALWFLTTSTVFGRNAYMVGANRAAAHLAGVNVQRNIFIGFVLMGALYGLASILFTARLNASTGSDALFLELDAIAASVIGGVALSGGKGRIPAVLGGALLLSAIDNGMSVMELLFLQQIVKGGILLVAVTLDVRSRRK